MREIWKRESGTGKAWEVVEIHYDFDKNTRKLIDGWSYNTHYKFYMTEQACLDACKELRRNGYQRFSYSTNMGSHIVLKRYYYKRTGNPEIIKPKIKNPIMETTTKMETGITAPTFDNVQNAINTLQSWAHKNGYRLDGNLAVDPATFNSVMPTLSKTQKKKLGRSIHQATTGTNFRSANRFLHTLFKKVLKSEKCPKVLVSEREAQIQEARRKWVTARNAAKTALAEYKATKGDYYK